MRRSGISFAARPRGPGWRGGSGGTARSASSPRRRGSRAATVRCPGRRSMPGFVASLGHPISERASNEDRDRRYRDGEVGLRIVGKMPWPQELELVRHDCSLSAGGSTCGVSQSPTPTDRALAGDDSTKACGEQTAIRQTRSLSKWLTASTSKDTAGNAALLARRVRYRTLGTTRLRKKLRRNQKWRAAGGLFLRADPLIVASDPLAPLGRALSKDAAASIAPIGDSMGNRGDVGQYFGLAFPDLAFTRSGGSGP